MLTHRRMRAAQIRDCLAAGIGDVTAIVARLYSDIEPRLKPAASQMVRAHLEHMRREGRADEAEGCWRLNG